MPLNVSLFVDGSWLDESGVVAVTDMGSDSNAVVSY
jgi:hypothetical protein